MPGGVQGDRWRVRWRKRRRARRSAHLMGVWIGVGVNLVLFLTRVMGQDNAEAANSVSKWTGTVYIFSLVGAFLSDSYWGRQGLCRLPGHLCHWPGITVPFDIPLPYAAQRMRRHGVSWSPHPLGRVRKRYVERDSDARPCETRLNDSDEMETVNQKRGKFLLTMTKMAWKTAQALYLPQ